MNNIFVLVMLSVLGVELKTDAVLLKINMEGFRIEVRYDGCTIIDGKKHINVNDETCKALIRIYTPKERAE